MFIGNSEKPFPESPRHSIHRHSPLPFLFIRRARKRWRVGLWEVEEKFKVLKPQYLEESARARGVQEVERGM
jgi:hypothetical protein